MIIDIIWLSSQVGNMCKMAHSYWFPERAIISRMARSGKSNFMRMQLMAFGERDWLFVDVVESVDQKHPSNFKVHL